MTPADQMPELFPGKSESSPFGRSERVKPLRYSYSSETPAEQVYTDYKVAFGALVRVHERTSAIAQGEKYFHSNIAGDPMTYFGSGDDLSLSAESYMQAAKNLYAQDAAARQYKENNLDALILQATEDMHAQQS
jgi:hypothetical protein